MPSENLQARQNEIVAEWEGAAHKAHRVFNIDLRIYRPEWQFIAAGISPDTNVVIPLPNGHRAIVRVGEPCIMQDISRSLPAMAACFGWSATEF